MSLRLTRFEVCNVIGKRAEQLSLGAKPMVEPRYTDPIKIAIDEIVNGKCPFIVCRKIDDQVIKIEVTKESAANYISYPTAYMNGLM